MDKLFRQDSSVMRFLGKLAQLMLLNLLMLLCFLPVLPGGAAVTAAYDVLWRGKDLEDTVWRAFWKAFRSNFRQATVLWMIFLVSGGLMGYTLLFILHNAQAYSPIIFILLLLAVALWAMTGAWAFPLQSRFQNSIPGTLRSAVLFAIGYLPKSLMMALLNLFPVLLFLFNTPLFLRLGVLFLTVWFGFAAFMDIRILRKPFEATIRQLGLAPESQK